MKSELVLVNNAVDIKDEDGLWVKSYSPSLNVRHTTRSSALWSIVSDRCKVGGAEQRRKPTYIGCSVLFEDYQAFAEWCNEEYGYMNKNDNGRFWNLDKDLLVEGNKVYGPDTCLFVPQRVNVLLIKKEKCRGEWPLGVCCKANSRFYSACSYKGVDTHLGVFDTPMEAHRAWQKFKIKHIKEVIKEDEIYNHEKLRFALNVHVEKLQYELDNGLETI